MAMSVDAAPVAAGEQSAARTAPYASTAYAWFVVGALSVTNMVSYVERLIPTLLFAPIKKDFGLSDTQVSLLAGFAFVLFYVLFGVLIGRLADRSNRKRIIVVGIFFWSLATMTCGLARNFAQLFLARISVGVGEATLGPSATSMISDYFPRERLARALSIYTGAQYLGAGLALVVGGFAIQLVAQLSPPVIPGIGRIAPWQMTFLAVGLLGMFVLIPMLFVKEPPRRGLIATGLGHKGVPFSELWAFMKLNRGTFGAIYGAFSIHAILGFGTVAWIPSYFVRVHGWQSHDIGYVYGMMVGVLGTAGVVLGARFAEWIAARGYVDAYVRAPLIVTLVIAVPQVLSTLMPTAELSLALLGVCTLLSSFPVAVAIASLQIVTPNQMRGQVLSFYLFSANILGLGLGPTFVAMITDYIYKNEHSVGYSLSTAVALILPIVAVTLWLGLKPFRESLARADAWSDVPQERYHA
jgi:MFS family permease